jgi:hypothetical protein
MNRIKLHADDWLLLLGTIGLSPEEIIRLSMAVGFRKRKERKINLAAFLAVLLSESVHGAPSLNDLAAQMEALTHIGISKQTLGNKINETCVKFIQAVWAWALSHRFATRLPKIRAGLGGRYHRILIQDSTLLLLPARLFPEFSGVANGHAQVCNARVQVVYDLLAGEFVSFALEPYSKNDVTAAPDLALRAGDLVLRDRGYLTYDEIQRHVTAGADCIYRHKAKNRCLDPETGRPLDLSALLKRQGRIDMEVLLPNEARTRVRLVAVPVDEETANRRRQKLKQDGHGKNPSPELLFLQSWTIFLTTIPAEVASFAQLQAMYGLRWRIETIFKTWKSYLHLGHIHNVSSCQLRILVLARLIAAVLLQALIYRPACRRIRNTHGRILSLLKFTKYLVRLPNRMSEILRALLDTPGPHPVWDALARYCTYDKRKRLNFVQKMEACFEAWSLS